MMVIDTQITERSEAPGLLRDERKRATARRRMCAAPAQRSGQSPVSVSDIKSFPFDKKDET